MLGLLFGANELLMNIGIWVFLLAIMICVDSFGTMIIIFAVTQIADELIFAPIAKHFRSKFSINKSIDLRNKK